MCVLVISSLTLSTILVSTETLALGVKSCVYMGKLYLVTICETERTFS
jgi:hypothetical protein